MKEFNAKDYLDRATDQPTAGLELAGEVIAHLRSGDTATVDLQETTGLTSAFLNVFFSELLDALDEDAATRIEWIGSSVQKEICARCLRVAQQRASTQAPNLLQRWFARRT